MWWPFMTEQSAINANASRCCCVYTGSCMGLICMCRMNVTLSSSWMLDHVYFQDVARRPSMEASFRTSAREKTNVMVLRCIYICIDRSIDLWLAWFTSVYSTIDTSSSRVILHTHTWKYDGIFNQETQVCSSWKDRRREYILIWTIERYGWINHDDGVSLVLDTSRSSAGQSNLWCNGGPSKTKCLVWTQ
jgi:hypothetical protein